MTYILAIDQGTTGSRVVVYDKGGRRVASAYREFRQHFPKPGWVEHDPAEIWRSVRLGLRDVLGEVPASSVAAIGITNQRETTVVWDRTTGQPVHNAIVWQCRRTSARCDALKNRKGMSALFGKRTGLPIDAYFSATKIEWILENVKGARAKARAGRLCFGTTDSWLLWQLTGGAVHATDYTNASRTMLFNLQDRAWDADLLKLFGIPGAMLPEVRASAGVFGATVRMGRLPAGIPIAGVAGDQQAALFGQACFEPGSVKNTYGTGAFVLMNAGRRRPISRHRLIVTLGCGASGEPVYALEGAIFVAGAAIQWLRDELGFVARAAESERLARAVAGNAGVYFVPALVGLGAPYWDPAARGLICGITRGTKRAHIVRAALEAMCYQTRDVLEAMQKDAGHRIGSLKVDGGAAANDFLCQFQADVLGIPVIRPRVIESTSLGAAYLAGLAVGYWRDTRDILDRWAQDRAFKPAMPKRRANSLYREWQQAVARALAR
ncbi:MAG: glycerol kinase GlpK [Kiritimatiellae bacterium]|nr:glycerol kinase GlpK [Kiritimatiellia bacterium]